MPDATHGVPVRRSRDGHLGDWDYWAEDGYEYPNTQSEPGTWYPADEAAALEALYRAVKISSRLDVEAATSRLDAIRNDKEKDR